MQFNTEANLRPDREKARLSSRIVARAVAAEVTRRKCFPRQNPPPTPEMRLKETLALTPALCPRRGRSFRQCSGIFMLSGAALPHGDLRRRLPFLQTHGSIRWTAPKWCLTARGFNRLLSASLARTFYERSRTNLARFQTHERILRWH